MTTPNMNEIFEQSMKQFQTNIDEMRSAGEAWTQLWTEQTRANLELLTRWQQQSTELLSSFTARGTELGSQERERFEKLAKSWQTQWQAGAEQGSELVRSFGETAEDMLHKSQAQMAELTELMGSFATIQMPTGTPAAKTPAAKTTKR